MLQHVYGEEYKGAISREMWGILWRERHRQREYRQREFEWRSVVVVMSTPVMSGCGLEPGLEGG